MHKGVHVFLPSLLQIAESGLIKVVQDGYHSGSNSCWVKESARKSPVRVREKDLGRVWEGTRESNVCTPHLPSEWEQ